MRSRVFLAFGVATAASICLSVRAGLPITVGYDNADDPAYAPQPNHNWSPINGGFGYNTWTALGGAAGGGTYMEGVGVNCRQVEGHFSFSLFSRSGSFATLRPLPDRI